jgi:GntR family transcriptional repressor for pyruvate dehydrogenase complex
VVAQIRDAVFSGLRPGDWLGTESELAAKLGVSRLTMRDAVRTLEAQGMVEVRVGAAGGLRVAQPSPAHLAEALAVQTNLLGISWDEIIEALVCVEPQVAGLAALRRSEEHLDRLRSSLEVHRSWYSDLMRFHEATRDFHLSVAEASGNGALYVALRALRMTEERMFSPFEELPNAAPQITRDHAQILDAIEAGDRQKAEEAMRAHHLWMQSGQARRRQTSGPPKGASKGSGLRSADARSRARG